MPDDQEDDQRQKEDIVSTVEGGIILEKPVAISSGIAMIADGIIIDNHSHTALHGSSHPIVWKQEQNQEHGDRAQLGGQLKFGGDNEGSCESADDSVFSKPTSGDSSAEGSSDVIGVKMKREHGLVNALAIIVGTIIGSGIFVSPIGALRGTGSVGLSVVIWIACSAKSLIGSLCYQNLRIIISNSGGVYAYLYKAFGPLPALLQLLEGKCAGTSIAKSSDVEEGKQDLRVWNDIIREVALLSILYYTFICFLYFLNSDSRLLGVLLRSSMAYELVHQIWLSVTAITGGWLVAFTIPGIVGRLAQSSKITFSKPLTKATDTSVTGGSVIGCTVIGRTAVLAAGSYTLLAAHLVLYAYAKWNFTIAIFVGVTACTWLDILTDVGYLTTMSLFLMGATVGMFINGTTTKLDEDWDKDWKEEEEDQGVWRWVLLPIVGVIAIVVLSLKCYFKKRARDRAVANSDRVGQCGATTQPRSTRTNHVPPPTGTNRKQQSALPSHPTQQAQTNTTGFDKRLYTNQYGTEPPPPAYEPPSYDDATRTTPS